jgi:hypothetical protein
MKQIRRSFQPSGVSKTTLEHQNKLAEKKKGLPKRPKATMKPYQPRGTPGSRDKRL